MFGERLKELMLEQEISQNKLSKKIGYTQKAISKWINNQSEPTESAIRACAIYFKVTTDYLLGLEDETGTKTYSTTTKYNITTLNNNGNINMT